MTADAPPSELAEVRVTRERNVAWLTFDNQSRLNALTPEMRASIEQHMRELALDDDVRALVIRGAGDRAFSSGGDISRLPNGQEEPPSKRAAQTIAIAQFPKPVIAMINGWCLGGGLGIALSADIRIASESAMFGIPAARLGIVYTYEVTERLVRLVGPAHASEILFSGQKFEAERALQIGLVNRVVPGDQLEAKVSELAGTIAANAPISVRGAKAVINVITTDPGQRDTTVMDRLMGAWVGSRDFQEGREAYRDKREPRFIGA